MQKNYLYQRVVVSGLIFLSLVVNSCLMAAPEENTLLDLRFGVYRTDKATLMYQEFMPILNYLENDLGKRLNKTVSIELVIFKTYMDGIDALVANNVDFVRFGPSSYILAKQRNDAVKLLVMEHKGGQKLFNGVVVVKRDSPYKNLAELKGTRFAFGDENSTIGRFLVQEQLIKAGLKAGDFSAYEYLGRHDKVFMSVVLGEFDAGSIKESSLKSYNSNRELRVIHSFVNVTKPWIAKGNLDPAVYEVIKNALLELVDPSVLKGQNVSGFIPTSDSEYDFVRQGMRAAMQFDVHHE